VTHQQAKEQLIQAEQEMSKGNYTFAERECNQVLANFENLPLQIQQIYEWRSNQSYSLRILGSIAWRIAKYNIALQYLNQAYTISIQIHDDQGLTKIIGNLGNVYMYMGDHTKALEYFNQALLHSEESGEQHTTAFLCVNIGLVYANIADYNQALEMYNRALYIFEMIEDILRIAQTNGNIGSVYTQLGDYKTALEYNNRALSVFQTLGLSTMIAGAMINVGIVYYHLGQFTIALEYMSKALSTHKELGDTTHIARAMGNMASIYADLQQYQNALDYYLQAIEMYQKLGEQSMYAKMLQNLGTVYAELKQYDKAIEILLQSYELHKELGEKSALANVMTVIGSVYSTTEYKEYNLIKAQQYLVQSLEINQEIGAKKNLYEAHKLLASIYKQQEQWKQTQYHFEQFHTLKEEVHNEHVQHQANLLEQRRLIEEREKGLAIERAKHEATQKLLFNVLPPSIARRMIEGEHLIAEKLQNVSVLFADIVNFTKLSQLISAEELVQGLNTMFSAFDSIADKYHLEKIKTIGDAYMVVAGAPEPRADHALAIASMAIEMMEAMHQFRSKSTGKEIHIRIGIHSGEVVAGVIGKKKFSYDLWGDAVNTASRMETHGEPGKVHISNDFRIALKTMVETQTFASLPEHLSYNTKNKFHFIPRGEMQIKGKGIMHTYFLEKQL
jgi:class 3 adenylate cyclase/Tfp pilus assembly protein PilF